MGEGLVHRRRRQFRGFSQRGRRGDGLSLEGSVDRQRG
jgi:hypothetical protein